MTPYRFYIQQTSFDGEDYTKGSVVDTYLSFGAVCKSFDEQVMPEAKSLVTRNWVGEDGVEVYVPDVVRMKEFDINAEFIITGNESLTDDAATQDAQSRRKAFIKFLYGRNTGSIGGRLAIYDEHSGIGYKDVVCSKVTPDTAERQFGGNGAVYVLKVVFKVCDPVTDVTPHFTNNVIDELIW